MVTSIKSQLLRKEIEFIHNKVDTICTKDFPTSFPQLGKRVGPFKIGHPYTLDQYVARIFVERGYLKFDGDQVDCNTIKKINFQESTNTELRKIPQDHIYVQAMEQLNILDKFADDSRKAKQEYKTLRADINDLLRVRLAKINRLAMQSEDLKSKKLLTSEEIILFDVLSQAVREWREHLSNA